MDVTIPWGRTFGKALEEARLLWLGGIRLDGVGPEHFLLAVAAEPSVAADALAELGVTHERLVEYLGSLRYEAPDVNPEQGLSTNRAAHEVMGWALGFAAASGVAQPEPADYLLATLYTGAVAGDLDALGVSAGAVMDSLRRRGVRAPGVEPPVYRPWRGLRRVEIPEAELQPAIELLSERYPSGSWRWGFNYVSVGEPRRALLISEEGLDLDAIVAEVRGVGRNNWHREEGSIQL